jgi:hypothetical protein
MKALLYPKIRLGPLPAMLRYAVVGAFIAGIYGIIHDQITYSIYDYCFKTSTDSIP